MTQPPGDDRHYQQYPQYPPTGAYAQQQPPPNWGPPSPQKPPAIQDEIRRGLATTKGKLIAIALVVAAITTITVVAVVGSKVAFGDSGESFDLGHGVHVTITPPDDWTAQVVTNSNGKHVLLQRESDPISPDDALSGVADIAGSDAPDDDIAIDAAAITAESCSDNEPDSLEANAFSRQGAWMSTPILPGRDGDYRMVRRAAVRTADSCSGYTVGATAASGSKTGTPSSDAADLVSQITDGEIITSVEIK